MPSQEFLEFFTDDSGEGSEGMEPWFQVEGDIAEKVRFISSTYTVRKRLVRTINIKKTIVPIYQP